MSEVVLYLEPFTNLTTLILNNTRNPKHAVSVVGTGQHGSGLGPPSLSSPPPSLSSSSLSSSGETGEWGVTCRDWQDAQHALFQLANLCAAISLLTPGSFRYHLLFLRCLLLVAFFLFVLWAGLFVCMVDVLIWNGIFLLVDLVHIIGLAYHNFPGKFSTSLADYYSRRLKPLRLCTRDYSDLCSVGEILPLRMGCHYAQEGFTESGRKLSVLLRGRLKVSVGDIFLHYVEPNEFVDSPEFDAVPLTTDHSQIPLRKFQVTITACEDCLVLTWHRVTLTEFLEFNPFLAAVLMNLVGKDVSDKLYRVQEQIMKEGSNSVKAHSSRDSSLSGGRTCGATPDLCSTHAHDGSSLHIPGQEEPRLVHNNIRANSNASNRSSTCSRCSRVGVELTVETTL